MRLHRFIVEHKLATGVLTLTDADVIHQIGSVLRLGPGSDVLFMDGKGKVASVRIVAIDKRSLTAHVSNVQQITTEPHRKVTLFCSILKRENFEWVVQKCTEVGIARIVPVIADRTVKTGLKSDRLLRIIREAVEQCGRGVVPELLDPMTFDAARLAAPSENVFFHLGSASASWKQGLPDDVGVWIGPEGGWSDREVDQAGESGWRVSSMGSLALRAETAAVVGAYEVIHAGD